MTLEKLTEAVIEGAEQEAKSACQILLDENTDPQKIIEASIIPAMDTVGNRFESGEFFLPEMMAAALATKSCMSLLQPLLTASGVEPRGTAILGTVQGDLHDIGKNLVGMMWEGAGFRVVDLGADVPAKIFIDEIRKGKAQLLGLSALLTTTMPMMRTTIDAITDAGLREGIRIVVGGAGVTQSFADEIGADGYAPDAGASVRKAKALLGLD